GAAGGSERGRHVERGGAIPSGTQPQSSHARPPRGRLAQNRTGKQGKHAQASDLRTFPLDTNPPGVSGTQSESAISGQEITGGECLFYGANVGTENRNVEFKRGGGEYLRSSFRGHLRRYACAFLNSGGGSLLAGVDDDGVVQGLHCDHRQEDRARLLADSVLKGFHPPLLPHSYSLDFLPVLRPGPEGRDLKVLRLTLRPPPAPALMGLYQTDLGEVFLRRDGSVEGPLSASAIQEWARQRWSVELSRLQQHVEVLLSEQRLLLLETRQQRQIIADLHSSQTQAQAQPWPLVVPDLRRDGSGKARSSNRVVSSVCRLM
ncbi:schlafen-like protein 1, partial [Osmerus eperlanus]|uniref:schlafen-like protein 1 n=1 Tax=Osmerus eperlanus TaxID=29151 RepID=UPI002E155C26